MIRKELTFGYDKEVDVLYISLGKPQKGMQYIELSTNLIIRVEPKSKEIVGITIIDFSKQFSGDRQCVQQRYAAWSGRASKRQPGGQECDYRHRDAFGPPRLCRHAQQE